MCSDAPDYSPMADASAAATAAAQKAAAEDLAFRKDVYNQNLPYIQQAQTIGLDNAGKQGQIADQMIERGNTLLREDTQYGQAAREQMYQDAQTVGSVGDQERAAGRAVSDVSQQSAIAQQSLENNLRSMGINPNSGKFASGMRMASMADAKNRAGAATNSREMQRDKGLAARAAAANFSQGMGNSISSTYGTAMNAGNSAGGNAGNAANANLQNAGFVAGGYGSQMDAARMGMSHAGNLGQIANWESQDNGLMTGLGSLAMGAGAMGVKFSDARLKTGVEKVGNVNGHDIYEFSYVDGHGLPNGKFTGVLAQDVIKIDRDAVTVDANGFMLVDYDRIGVEMRRVA